MGREKEQFEFLVSLAAVAGGISLRDALALADRVGKNTTLDTHEGKVAYAKTDPVIQALLADRKQIQAIKELREVCSREGVDYSLVACKNAIDEVKGHWF